MYKVGIGTFIITIILVIVLCLLVINWYLHSQGLRTLVDLFTEMVQSVQAEESNGPEKLEDNEIVLEQSIYEEYNEEDFTDAIATRLIITSRHKCARTS